MKRVLSFIIAIIVISTLAVPFSAVSNSPKVVDDAKTMSDAEVKSLSAQLEEVSKNSGIDVVVVTIPTLTSGTMQSYADDYYDYNGYANDGCLLLVAVEDNARYISTKGFGITALTDWGIQNLGAEVRPIMEKGKWYDAFVRYGQLVDEFVAEARNGKPYDTNHKRGSTSDLIIAILISLGIGLVISLIVVLSIKSKYKPVRLKAEANDYLVDGSLQLKESYDHFLYTHVTRTRRSDDKGGGSSTHTSSSGSSHGGGSF